jgi:ASC-1-like (ASCH) protein
MTHELIVLDRYFQKIIDRRKTFEVRRERQDRRFAVGDILELYEVTEDLERTGRVTCKVVLDVMHDDVYLLIPQDIAILSLGDHL